MSQTSTNQTTTQQAPSWQLPYQQYGQNQALGEYQGVNSPTQLIAPFSQQQNQAISGIQNIANNNGTGNAASSWAQNVLSGSPANNPYLNSEFTQGANAVQNQLSSEFANSGRGVIGSLPIQSDEMNNLASQLYGGAYNTGVQEQTNAANMAPNLVNSQLGVQQGLFNAGQQVQNLAQNYIQAPQSFLNQYLSQVNGNLGQTTTQPMYYNNGLMALGGANLGGQAGQALGSYFGNGSLGQGIGTLAGGLLGAYGG